MPAAAAPAVLVVALVAELGKRRRDEKERDNEDENEGAGTVGGGVLGGEDALSSPFLLIFPLAPPDEPVLSVILTSPSLSCFFSFTLLSLHLPDSADREISRMIFGR